MKESLAVRRSPIHGRGLFATRPIAADTVIGRYRTEPTDRPGPYSLWSGEHRDCEDVICRFRFLNHSDRPNVALYDDYSVVALRPIEPGEELTLDYDGDGAGD